MVVHQRWMKVSNRLPCVCACVRACVRARARTCVVQGALRDEAQAAAALLLHAKPRDFEAPLCKSPSNRARETESLAAALSRGGEGGCIETGKEGVGKEEDGNQGGALRRDHMGDGWTGKDACEGGGAYTVEGVSPTSPAAAALMVSVCTFLCLLIHRHSIPSATPERRHL